MSFYDNLANQRFIQGYGPAQQQPVQKQPAFSNFTTPEDRKILNGGPSTIKLTPSSRAKAQAHCFHRDTNSKMFTLYPLNDGSGYYRCNQCHALVKNLDDLNPTIVREVYEEFKAIFEATKAMDLNCTEEVANTFYVLMAYFEPFPEMYEYAEKLYSRYYGTNNFGMPVNNNNYYNGTPTGFNAFDVIMGNRSMVPPTYGSVVPNGAVNPNPNAGYPGMGGVPMTNTNFQAANMVNPNMGNPLDASYNNNMQSMQMNQQMPVQAQPQQRIMVNNELPPVLQADQQRVPQAQAPVVNQPSAIPVQNNNTGDQKKTFTI